MGLGTSSAYPLSRMPAPPQKRTTFMTYLSPAASVDSHSRNRNDKTPAPLANVPQLLHDFVFQIPREDHDIVGLGFANTIGVVDRYVGARQVSGLLVRTAIDGVFDQIFSDAAVMQERGALARRPVTGHLLALSGS